MNQVSQYIFNLYHYLFNLRDTLEYTLPREHDEKVYQARKNVLVNGIKTGSALGNFLDQNKEAGDKLRAKINEFIEQVYGEESTILSLHEGKVRVDHTQHIVIYDTVVGLTESIRDIIWGYINHARGEGNLEQDIPNLLILDDRFYRNLVCMLMIQDFEKSFVEFQKVFGENGGKPSPQSNYIVQNELQKMAGMIRFVRTHNHCTDNKTLDILDRVVQLVEMTEGRRDRRDNKSFQELFTEVKKECGAYITETENAWKELYEKMFKEMIEIINQEKAAKQA